MGITAVKIKLMPTSPSADLNHIEQEAKRIVESNGGINKEYEIEPIAFGLKAVIAFFQWPEEKEIESLEESLKKIKEVQSVRTIDMRKMA